VEEEHNQRQRVLKEGNEIMTEIGVSIKKKRKRRKEVTVTL
jgi:hypothetical protein